jgi:putative membrane protein
MVLEDSRNFWRVALAWQGSVTPLVMPQVLFFGLIATVICIFSWLEERLYQLKLGLEIAPFELAGAALGLLLILRTNAGYDRWWEARKLWGGIVNQSRNVVISALSYGPADPVWRERFVKWAAVFPHVARCSLRGEQPSPEVAALVGQDGSAQIAASAHMPSFVALQLADLLREACDAFNMDRFAFMQVDRERAALIDHWLVPLITMMVAYPLLSLDQIGIELQNPFSKANLSHLPIGEISANIERNVLGLLKEKQSSAP